MLMKKLLKQMQPFLESHGFKLCGKVYYKIIHNIAFCLEFEIPGGLYVLCYPLPFYMPNNVRSYQYGVRLAASPYKELPFLDKTAGEDQIVNWCQVLSEYLLQNIFPYFEDVSEPIALAEFFKKKKNRRKICCTDLGADRLLLFTYLFLEDKKNFEKVVNRYRNNLKNCSYLMPNIIKELEKEAERISCLMKESHEQIEIFFSSVVEENIRVHFPEKSNRDTK